jgi:Holliday junction DNA helicase RuvA
MIAKLTGVLDSVGEDWAIVDVHGVGYFVSCSGRTLGQLGRPGDAVTLFTEARVRDEMPHLYGFGSRREQDWFRALTTVQGVGAKVALAILSVLDPDALSLALVAGDKAALARADGVGPKLAARIAAELKDRAQVQALHSEYPRPAAGPAAAPVSTQPSAEAVSALVNLGFGRADAYAAVMKIARDGDLAVGDLIRLGLRELSALGRDVAP